MIIPNIIVTCIAIISLWIPELPTRLTIEVTALLTIMAMLWVTSSNIPPCKETSWIQSFTTNCMLLVGACTFESSFAAALAMRFSDVPEWQKSFFREVAVRRNAANHFICCFIYSPTVNEKNSEASVNLTAENRFSDLEDISAIDVEENQSEIIAAPVAPLTPQEQKEENHLIWIEKANTLDFIAHFVIPFVFIGLLVSDYNIRSKSIDLTFSTFEK